MDFVWHSIINNKYRDLLGTDVWESWILSSKQVKFNLIIIFIINLFK